MKPISMSISLLLMFFVRAQGVLLEQASMPLGQQKIQEEKEKILVGEVVICSQGQCSGGSRKLMTKTSSTSKIVKSQDAEIEGQVRREEIDTNRENSVKSMVSAQKFVPRDQYPDIIDIAGMDYAPAKRKPPIHN